MAIYLSHIQELADYKLTLFHEFAHAVDHLLFDVKYSERRIEQIAQNTYQTNEELFEFIKEMYRLPEIRFGKK